MASLGGGIAKGLVGGQTLKLQKQELRQVEDAAKAKAAEARSKRMQEALEKSKTDAEEAFGAVSEAMVEIAPFVEDDDPNFQQLQRGALASLTSHAMVLQQMKEVAAAEGAPQELIDALPDPMEFIQSRLPVLEAQVTAARLAKAQEPIDEGSFFADVTGVGNNVRVTERDTPEGTKFFVDNKEVPGSAIGKPIERRQEVTGLQIPGLTVAQSGQEITAMRQQIAAANSYTKIASNLAQQVNEAPEKVGTIGEVIGAFGALTAQIDGLSNALGLESPFEDENGNPISREQALEEYNFGSLAGESQEVRRSLLDLVFLDLAAKGQTGRAVSDRDLEIFMRETGIKSGDPEQVIRGLARGVQNNQIQIQENVKTRSGGAFGIEKLAPGGLVEFVEPTSDLQGQVNARLDELLDPASLSEENLAKADELLKAIQANDTEKIKALVGGD